MLFLLIPLTNLLFWVQFGLFAVCQTLAFKKKNYEISVKRKVKVTFDTFDKRKVLI